LMQLPVSPSTTKPLKISLSIRLSVRPLEV
jgi:hypothetical protein